MEALECPPCVQHLVALSLWVMLEGVLTVYRGGLGRMQEAMGMCNTPVQSLGERVRECPLAET